MLTWLAIVYVSFKFEWPTVCNVWYLRLQICQLRKKKTYPSFKKEAVVELSFDTEIIQNRFVTILLALNFFRLGAELVDNCKNSRNVNVFSLSILRKFPSSLGSSLGTDCVDVIHEKWASAFPKPWGKVKIIH